MDTKRIEKDIRDILESIGEDTHREGLIETPKRVARMYKEIFGGVETSVDSLFEKKFKINEKSLVIVKDITFYSMCEHHLLPFYGKVNIAYISNDYVLGLSKFHRLVKELASKPNIQENFTDEIAKCIYEFLRCQMVVVKVEAEHMCIAMRGAKKEHSTTITYSQYGNMNKYEQDIIFKDI